MLSSNGEVNIYNRVIKSRDFIDNEVCIRSSQDPPWTRMHGDDRTGACRMRRNKHVPLVSTFILCSLSGLYTIPLHCSTNRKLYSPRAKADSDATFSFSSASWGLYSARRMSFANAWFTSAARPHGRRQDFTYGINPLPDEQHLKAVAF
jgi:hypothetical protein